MSTEIIESWPGIFPCIKPETYHAWPGVSPSKAFYALESAKSYKCALETKFATTDDMELGSACHTAVFEPDEMPLRVVVWTGKVRSGKEWDKFENVNHDKTILTASQYARLLKVRDSVQSHQAVQAVVTANGRRELSMRWHRDEDGITLDCRGRMDFLSDRIWDLKTTFDISDDAIGRTVCRLAYHMKLAAYRDGVRSNTGEEMPLGWIFAQTRPPYDARVVLLEGAELARGQELWREACATIARAQVLDRYDGISEEPQPLILSDWQLGVNEIKGPELTLDGVSMED